MMQLSKNKWNEDRLYDKFFWVVNLGTRGFTYHKDVDLYKVLQMVVYVDFREPLRYGVGARRIANRSVRGRKARSLMQGRCWKPLTLV